MLPSAGAPCEIVRQETKRIGGRAKGSKRIQSGASQSLDLGARDIHTEYGWIGHLASILVLANRLPDMLGRLGDIEQVIDHLEHQPDRLAPTDDRVDLRFLAASGNRSHCARTANERTCLLGMNRVEPLLRRLLGSVPPERVEYLPVDHLRCGIRDGPNNGIGMLPRC